MVDEFKLIKCHALHDFKLGDNYIKPDSDFAFNSSFENGVVKLQRREVVEIIDDERESC